LVGGIIFSFRFERVQTWAAKKATVYLSKELKTKISIDKLKIEPFKSVLLTGFYIQDLEKDTLLKASKLKIDISYFSPFRERKIILDQVNLSNAQFYFKAYKDSTTNLSFIIDYFNSGNKNTKVSQPFDFAINNVKVNDIDLRYRNFRVPSKPSNTINYFDIDIKDLSTSISNLDTKNFVFKAQINNLKFREKSGFVLNNLTALTTIDTNKIELQSLFLQTPRTTLTNYFSINYKDFTDFDDGVNKLVLKGNFKNAKVNSKDIAFFAPKLKNMDLNLLVSGNIEGTVSDLEAKNLTVKLGKASYIKGNFKVKGLPDVDNTYLDLNFKQVYTNKQDVEYIIEKFTGKKYSQLPQDLAKFGNVNFSGNFKGYINNFKAKADFKTKLGRIKSDVDMKINSSNIPSYTGTVQAFDFDLGDLTNQTIINRTSFTANINGRGFNLENLKENIKAKATYFDFNNYRYANIVVDGTIINQVFDGKVKINDKNIKLDFNGKADINPELPKFDFVAKIEGAKFHKLNFTKDTIQFDGKVKSKFVGNNLKNIQGDFLINDIRFTNTEKSVVMDSVFLLAEGLGKNRLLALTSDIGDARIKGAYDIETLPSAFKSIVKKYIPSYNGEIVKVENQNFDFKIDLKNFDYISSLFIPELKIPERGAFNGKFNSNKDSVVLNGFVKTLTYDGKTFSNIILDQSTGANSLEAIISMDKIELTKGGLYVKNVIIQNTLRNDSLTFNLKLSDKDATNQLDLYGLVEFGTDTLARLSLSPSEILIDNQVWKIQEKVRIKFDDNRTFIENFELSSDKQLVAINGAISSNTTDQLEVVIQDFKMSSLSQITEGFGVNLSGTMNGVANLSSILDQPNIASNITVDSLFYNNTSIGDLKLKTAYNYGKEDVDVDATIFKNNAKTMDIKGDVDFAKTATNNLNLDIILDQTELIIIQPFVKEIISNLKGQISSDLKLSGKFSNPSINGDLTFINAGLKVNYLQTAYTVNNKISVMNSVIDVNGLTLIDINGNKAVATGSINLKNPSNPLINASLDAKNFMALNTTSRNNQLYYGLAYSTGKFSFNGPLDAMRINIKAKTEDGTEFTIPLNGSSTVSSNDFIIYVAKDTTLNKKQVNNFFNGITMEFDLTVDEGSTANILTEVGNLTGQGTAQLSLKITSLGDFEMKGEYIINTGEFDFTANDLINKTFTLEKGGTIRWTGDPSDAQINLNAVYSTRASIAPIFAAAGITTDDNLNSRVLSEAHMLLNGSLLNPGIKFSLEFPNNSGYKTQLQGYLNDKDNEAQQVINLVVRNSFNGNTSAGLGGLDGQTLLDSGFELGFSKLNNVIAQTFGFKNVDINFRSISEFGVGLKFFSDRLKISGNVVNNQNINNQLFNNNLFNSSLNNLTRDLQATFDIRKDGSFVAKAFQRPSNRDFFNLNSDIYINGFGLVYTQQYDTFDEFIKQTFGRKKDSASKLIKEKEESKKRSETQQKPITDALMEEKEN
jgi:hypothetical protein